MNSIRREVGLILNQAIPANGWNQTFKELGREGKIDNAKLIAIVILLCKKMEAYEQNAVPTDTTS